MAADKPAFVDAIHIADMPPDAGSSERLPEPALAKSNSPWISNFEKYQQEKQPENGGEAG